MVTKSTLKISTTDYRGRTRNRENRPRNIIAQCNTSENILKDCQKTISSIIEESRYCNPIKLLIGMRKDENMFPLLFRIDAKGREENISKFTAIDSE